MTRIATAQLYQSSLSGILAAEQRQATAGQQINTGHVASDLKGYAPQAATLTATQTVKAKVDSYLAANTRLADRLSTQDLALTSTASASDGARQAVTQALANDDASTLIQRLQGWYGQASQALNTQQDGQYLFAGGASSAPVDTSTLTGLQTAATAASHFTNGSLKTSDRLDETTSISTGFTASQVGGPLFDALRNIAAYDADPATGPFGHPLTAAQTTFLTSQVATLQSATDGVNALAAQNGENQSRVDTQKAILTDRQTSLAGVLSGVTDVDPAEATTRLQLASVALQASAQVFQALSGTSLLTVLQS